MFALVELMLSPAATIASVAPPPSTCPTSMGSVSPHIIVQGGTPAAPSSARNRSTRRWDKACAWRPDARQIAEPSAGQMRCPAEGDFPMSELSEKQRDSVDDDKFAFPKERKEPLEDASHVRNAIARFDQVEGVSDDERDAAWKRIKKAADKYGVEVSEKSWRELGKNN
jgi:hypothetical protein